MLPKRSARTHGPGRRSLLLARAFILAAGIFAIARCAGGSSASSSIAGVEAASVPTAQVRLTLIGSSEAVARAKQYISPSTMALEVAITPSGGVPLAPLHFPCSFSSCTASFLAPVGNDMFALTITDGSNKLSLTAATPVQIRATEINSVSLTANPVVNSAAVKLGASASPAAATNAGTAADVPVYVQAYDADGNLIVGPGTYVDRNGTPLTLTLSATGAAAGGTGSVTLSGPTTFTAAGSTGTAAHYNGRWMESSTLTVAPSSSSVAQRSAMLTITPHAQAYATASGPTAITAGPDGNVWITEFLGNRIARIATDGSGYVDFGCGTCSGPTYVAAGADGNLWITGQGSATITRMSPGGAVLATIPSVSNPISIISAPDGYLYYSAQVGAAIGKIDSSGAVQNFPTPGGHRVHGIGYGSDGNIWYLDTTANLVGKMSTSGVYLAAWSAPGLSSGFPDAVVAGSDGNMWFPVYSLDMIDKITPGGALTSYPLRHGAAPAGIAAGPDGALWFGERGSGAVGRLTTDGHLTEFGAANGVTQVLGATTVGPDGNIWLTSGSSNEVVKFIY